MSNKETIKQKLLEVEVGHYTHFTLAYTFKEIVSAMEELHEKKAGFYTCKYIDIAKVFIVRRDG